MLPDSLREYTDAVSRFIFVEDAPEPADILFVPGSGHPAHVRRAARLFREGLAPLVLPSGFHAKGDDAFLAHPEYPSEWAWMRDILLQDGVPDGCILREDRSTFTWENAAFSRDVLRRLALPVRRAILCCRAHHARRALFYYQAAFPETRFFTVPEPDPGISRDTWFLTGEGRSAVLGEVRRMGSQITDIFDALAQGRTPPWPDRPLPDPEHTERTSP